MRFFCRTFLFAFTKNKVRETNAFLLPSFSFRKEKRRGVFMKLSLAPISLHRYFDTDKDQRTILELTKACGFTCVDYDIKQDYLDGDYVEHAERLKRNLAELGMTAPQAHVQPPCASGFLLPHSGQNLPVAVAPQAHFQPPCAGAAFEAFILNSCAAFVPPACCAIFMPIKPVNEPPAFFAASCMACACAPTMCAAAMLVLRKTAFL